MTKKEKELIEKYVEYKTAEEENRKAASGILHELAQLAPHKVGEIIEWTEKKQKNVGTMWNPKWVELKHVDKRAVLVRIKPSVGIYHFSEDHDYYIGYDFKLIKKDGTLHQNQVYPPRDYVWTGEMYDKEI